MHTPSARPGFVPTQGNSRRALVPQLPKVKKTAPVPEDDNGSEPEIVVAKKAATKRPGQARNADSGLKQVASRTGKDVTVNLDQDSDAEHDWVLNLPKAIVRPEKADKPFPVLYSIPEEDENDSSNEITKITNQPADQSEDKYDDVDPDNAEAPHQEPGWENEIDEDILEEGDQTGIAFTLKKKNGTM
ncbi:hypothetical protein PtB15_7B529 [Puccinia triticina]|nr:hypothetical protein PtB15_7B529 [Puccinia triticina]